ncbi:MAG: oligosaccharide flippase family protein [bacterium]|nr:oligosaccharide flippase family protein [bacterium]
MIRKIKNLFKGKRLRQVGSLYITMLLGMAVGIANSVITTRFLGVELYGQYKFIMHVFNFVVVFLTIGFFTSGGRLLAREKYSGEESGISGVMLAFSAVISAVMIIGLFVFSFFQGDIFNNQLGSLIRMLSPLLFVFPMKLCLESMMTGRNEIYKLSIFRLFPKVFYLASTLLFHWLFKLTLTAALLFNLIGLLIIIVVMAVLLKPKFNKLKKYWLLLKGENKTYGFPVYISVLANTATMRLSLLSIAYFSDNADVGFVGLAITITLPLSMIPRVVGTTFFKHFANSESIPGKAVIATVGLAMAALAAFLVFFTFVFELLYTKAFLPALPVIYFFAAAALLQGFGDFVNRFLGAHGKGKDMRSSGFIVAASNILGYTLLVKFLLVDGVMITRVASGLVYLLTMIYFYGKLRRQIKDGTHVVGSGGKNAQMPEAPSMD